MIVFIQAIEAVIQNSPCATRNRFKCVSLYLYPGLHKHDFLTFSQVLLEISFKMVALKDAHNRGNSIQNVFTGFINNLNL